MKYLLLILTVLTAQSMYAQSGWFRLNSGVQVFLRHVVFESPDSGFVVGASATVLRTIDGGLTWNRIPVPVDSTVIFNRIVFTDSQTGCIVGARPLGSTDYQTVILRTTNGGSTWEPYPRDTLGYLLDISFPTSMIGYSVGGVYSRQRGLIATTTDGGNNWSYRRLNYFDSSSHPWGTFSRVCFRNVSVGLAITSMELHWALWRTTDGGITWKKLSNDKFPAELEGIAHVGDSTWLLGSTINTMRSTDDGDTWVRVVGRPPDTLRPAGAFGFYNGLIGYSVGGQSQYGYIEKTIDGGLTWTLQKDLSTEASMVALAVPSANVAYAVGVNGVILKTVDGGGGPSLSTPEPSQPIHTELSATFETGMLHARFEASDNERTLLLYNLLGRPVRTAQVDRRATSIALDVGDLPAGMYWCRLGNETVRVIVLR